MPRVKLRAVRLDSGKLLGYVGDQVWPSHVPHSSVCHTPQERERDGDRWRVYPRLTGTPFFAMSEAELRAWSVALDAEADRLASRSRT